MTRKQHTYQLVLNISIILIILNLVLFFTDVMVLVFTDAIDCSSEEFLCDIDSGYAFFGATMWIFGGLAVAFMVVARVMHLLVQRGEKLLDADQYRKSMKTQESRIFSKTALYQSIRKGEHIRQRTDPGNPIVVRTKEISSNMWKKISTLFKKKSQKKRPDVASVIETQQKREIITSDEPKEQLVKEEVKILKNIEEDKNTDSQQEETTSKDTVEEVHEVVDPSLNRRSEQPKEVPSNEETKKKKKQKKKNITKTSLIKIIYSETDLSKNKASQFLDSFLDVIQEELVNRNEIEMNGIGHFTTIEMPEKDAINPQTKEKIVVPAHHQVRFRFDDEFEKRVNEALLDDEDDDEEITEEKPDEETIPKSPDKKQQKTNEAHKVIDPDPIKPTVSNDEENEPVKETVKTESEKPKKKKKKKRKSITKTKLINIINKETDLSKNKSSQFLDSMLDVIQEQLVKRNEVEMNGIGHFTTIEMPEKDAINPQTKEKIVVPAHHQVRFRFDDDFKDSVQSYEDED